MTAGEACGLTKREWHDGEKAGAEEDRVTRQRDGAGHDDKKRVG